MAGCGFDAAVVERLHRRRTGHVRRRSYFKPIVAAIRSYRYPELRVYLDDGPAGAGQSAVAAFRPLAFCIQSSLLWGRAANRTPGRRQRRPVGRVHVSAREHLARRCATCGAVLLAEAPGPGRLHDAARGRLRITAEEETPYQLDGDPGGVLPVEIEVLPGRLTLLAAAEETD